MHKIVFDPVLRNLDDLIDRFFSAVSFKYGNMPAYEELFNLFVASGLLVKNSGDQPEIMSVPQFIYPRMASVLSGELSHFREYEESHRTEVFGNVAHRLSRYSKHGTLGSRPFSGRGMISTQFILTPIGWKISSMVWDDERAGLRLQDQQTFEADRAAGL